jgi:hypothetical protein
MRTVADQAQFVVQIVLTTLPLSEPMRIVAEVAA